MGFYSFKVFTNESVDLVDHMMTIGPGQDTFTTQVDDLEAFLGFLVDQGVTVTEVNQLDALSPIEPDPEILALQGGTPLLGVKK